MRHVRTYSRISFEPCVCVPTQLIQACVLVVGGNQRTMRRRIIWQIIIYSRIHRTSGLKNRGGDLLLQFHSIPSSRLHRKAALQAALLGARTQLALEYSIDPYS